jgi:hypothetical protein
MSLLVGPIGHAAIAAKQEESIIKSNEVNCLASIILGNTIFHRGRVRILPELRS